MRTTVKELRKVIREEVIREKKHVRSGPPVPAKRQPMPIEMVTKRIRDVASLRAPVSVLDRIAGEVRSRVPANRVNVVDRIINLAQNVASLREMLPHMDTTTDEFGESLVSYHDKNDELQRLLSKLEGYMF